MKNKFRRRKETESETISCQPGSKETSCSPDRFDFARVLLSGIVVFTALCLAIALFGSLSRFETDETSLLVNMLNLSDLSIVPSGLSPRNPETAAPSVKTDYSPFMPLHSIDPKFLVIEEPEFPGKSYGNMP